MLWDYPRPQMVREKYQILDKGWTLNGRPIRLPYPPEAPFSGYQGEIGSTLQYEVQFRIPEGWDRGRILLHFGAVDQIAAVQCNGYELGRHEGGYLPFSFDITACLKRGQENTLTVLAVDTLSELYPYGKQSRTPGGMWYTPVSGIWQTVWLEPVPDRYLESVRLTPDLNGVRIEAAVRPGDSRTDALQVRALWKGRIPDKEKKMAPPVFTEEENLLSGKLIFQGYSGYLDVAGLLGEAQAWEPDCPQLYYASLACGEDEVRVYFGLREVEIRTVNKVPGVYLNGRRIFLHGLLDQGYFPGGIFVPPLQVPGRPGPPAGDPGDEAKAEASVDWEAYARDVLLAQSLGFNTLRKHVKIEPEQYYYFCDLYGMLVMQDMVNSGHYRYLRDTVLPTIGLRFRKDTGPRRPDDQEKTRREIFRKQMRDTIRHLYNHPCILIYTIFNEGWGQFCADEAYAEAKEADPTRLINAVSGWYAQRKSDFDSRHIYFKDRTLHPGKRPLLLSECGGFGMPVEGHLFKDQKKKNYSYGTSCDSPESLTERIVQMHERMVIPAIPKGLCGVIYTQLSDIEEEVNGITTYDREVLKVVPERMRKLADKLVRER